MTSDLGDLQEEILEKIFSYLPSIERQIIRHVCKNWETIVNDAYGIKLIINNANVELLYSTPSAIEVDFDSMTKPIVDEISFVRRVKTCTFRNMVVFYNLIPILQTCSNMVTLIFREVVVDLPEHSIQMPTNQILCLPHLQQLELHSWSFSDSLMTVLTFFTKVQFGQLKEIYVPSGYSPVLPINWIFSSTTTPDDATTNLEIHPLIRLVLKNIHTLEHFSFGTLNSPVKMKFYPYNLFGFIQLEDVEISLFHEVWTRIFQNQTHLKSLQIASCKIEQWGELRDSIIRNASTLKKVKLHGRTFGQIWDCEVFHHTQLQKLILNISLSRKTGLEFLPITLIVLDIDGPIVKSELIKILHLVNLEELYFKGLGLFLINIIPAIDNEEQIQLSLFCSFLIQLPRLKVLSFSECSSNSLDWDVICDWCTEISELHRIIFRQYYYDMNGQLLRHGFCLTFPTDIIIDWNAVIQNSTEDQVEEFTVIFPGCCSLLGLENED